jgi:hypothetical protein
MSDTIVISVSEFNRLKKIEEDLPLIIQKAKDDAMEEYKRKNLQRLHERRMADPQAHSKRVLEKYYEKREEILKRRKELYHKKKAEKNAAAEAARSAQAQTLETPGL